MDTVPAPATPAIFDGSVRPVKSYRQNQFREMSEIGKWKCGEIHIAKLQLPCHRRKPVIVKVPKESNDSFSEKERLVVMQHVNILKFVGLAHDANAAPWIVLEGMDNGILKEYLEEYQPDWNGLTKMAHGIASAMNYLHADIKVIHGDLATRNILVGPSNHIKLTDCGLFNAMYPTLYEKDDAGQLCPIRWMPPENLPEPKVPGQFTKKGDVWAYGIVCCELWMHGILPYGTMSHDDVMEYARAGTFPLEFMDVDASEYIIHIIGQCFKPLQYQRPTFAHIMSIIRENAAPSIVF